MRSGRGRTFCLQLNLGCSPGLGGDDDDLALAVIGRVDVVPGDDGSASFHGDGVLFELTGGSQSVFIDSVPGDEIERHAAERSECFLGSADVSEEEVRVHGRVSGEGGCRECGGLRLLDLRTDLQTPFTLST